MSVVPLPHTSAHFLTLVDLLKAQEGGLIMCRIADFDTPQLTPAQIEQWSGEVQSWSGLQHPPSARMLRRFLYTVPEAVKYHPEAVMIVGPEEGGFFAAVLTPPETLGEERQ